MASLSLNWLKDEVEKLFKHNRITEIREWRGVKQITYHAPSLTKNPRFPWQKFLLPWKHSYPHQFFWDSIAHIIVLRHIDVSLAKEELLSLLYPQEDSGFIPHLIWNRSRRMWTDRLLQFLFPCPYYSPYLQPPNLAQAVEAIFEVHPDESFLREVLTSAKAFYFYLDRTRNSGDGLLEIIHSYESGRDKAREFDLVYGAPCDLPSFRNPLFRLMVRHRRLNWDIGKIFRDGRFRVKDLMFNCIYAYNLNILSRLLGRIKDKEADFFRDKADAVEEVILGKMYEREAGTFFSLEGKSDKKLPMLNLTTFFPFLLESLPQDIALGLVNLLKEKFFTLYPVPVEPGLPCSKAIWRGGQSWIYTNWYILVGLLKQAEKSPEKRNFFLEPANYIVEHSLRLIEKSGFREFYDSRTGEGKGAFNFGWSTLILDMMKRLPV